MEQPSIEAKYRKLSRLAQALHIPVPEAFWELEVRDRHGRVIHCHKQRAHSWVRNAYNLMVCQACAVAADNAVGLAIVDTAGVTKSDTITQPTSGWSSTGSGNQSVYVNSGYGFYAGAGVDTFGIIVGSGSGAENFNANALGTKITNGVGAGQLSYAAVNAPSITTLGTTKKVEWVRFFNNNSGGAVTVNEVAIYTYGTCGNASVYYMPCRDLIAGGISVPNTGQLRVIYTIQLTYPA